MRASMVQPRRRSPRRRTLPPPSVFRLMASSRELQHGLANGALHRLAARHFRLPSEGFHATGVEADLGHVAEPTARLASSLDANACRIDSHRLHGPLRNLVHGCLIANGEVVAVDPISRLLVSEHHSVQTVLDM